MVTENSPCGFPGPLCIVWGKGRPGGAGDGGARLGSELQLHNRAALADLGWDSYGLWVSVSESVKWGWGLQSLGWEDPLEKEMATHWSILAWKKIPQTEEPGGPQSMGLQRVRRDFTHTHTHTHSGDDDGVHFTGLLCEWSERNAGAVTI